MSVFNLIFCFEGQVRKIISLNGKITHIFNQKRKENESRNIGCSKYFSKKSATGGAITREKEDIKSSSAVSGDSKVRRIKTLNEASRKRGHPYKSKR